MPHIPIGPSGQERIAASNPYLINMLRLTLGDQGWSFPRLAMAMGWTQQDRTEVTELAVSLGLMQQAPLAVKVKPLPILESADILILPVSLQPREPPPPPPPPKPSTERREPAAWTMDSTEQSEPVEVQESKQNEPASWIVDHRENDDG